MAATCRDGTAMQGVRLRGWPRPGEFDTLGQWLRAARRRQNCSGAAQARALGTAANTVYRWEANRARPRLPYMRRIRDGLHMPPALIVDALRSFYRDDTRLNVADERQSTRYWRFIATAVGSHSERCARDRIVEDHQAIARSVARRYSRLAEFDDLCQVALISLADAVTGYIPTLGPFEPYAYVCCRGGVRGYLSDRYYEGVPRELRPGFTAVRRAITQGLDRTGVEPRDDDLCAELDMSRKQVRAARAFLRTRNTSLDAPRTEGSRTLHDVVGATPSQYADAELTIDIERHLRHMPQAATLVLEHVVSQRPLADVAAGIGMPLTKAHELTQAALEALRPVLSSGFG